MPASFWPRPRSLEIRLLATTSLLAIAAAVAPGHAFALPTVFATQTYSINGGPSNTVSDSTVADVLPYFNVGTDSVFGHTYAYPSGSNGSRSSGTNNFSISGQSTFDQFFDNTSLVAENVLIPFEITNGQVATSMAATAAGFQTAGVEAKIVLTFDAGTPSTALDFKADMTLTSDGQGTSNLTYAQSGPQIGGPPLPANTPGVTSGNYSWNASDGLISTVLQPGDTLDFLYTISSYASGSMGSIGDCSGTGIGGAPPAGGGGYGNVNVQTAAGVIGGGGGTPSTGCYNSAIGRIGDPWNPDEVPQDVPEPMSAAVLGVGLAALAFNRRRRAA